jgi:hypothetical protein
MQQPSVGRVVHYVSHGTPVKANGSQTYSAQCRAAVVTEVDEDSVALGLCVLNPTGQFFHSLGAGGCAYDGRSPEARAGGTWHWPERV